MLVKGTDFGTRHGFSTRAGGVSTGALASLNLGRAVGDDPACVDENARRLAREAGLGTGQLVTVRQIHGDRILEATAAADADLFAEPVGEADGLVTNARGVALCILTADCVPVLLYAPDVGAVAGLHAGWRGTELEISRRGVEELVARYGARAGGMQAIIGPCIRRCCYEVDQLLAVRFAARFGEEVVVAGGEGPPPHLDLVEANRVTLVRAGLESRQIEVTPWCTACDPGRFFSHRRDRGNSGRQLSFVAL